MKETNSGEDATFIPRGAWQSPSTAPALHPNKVSGTKANSEEASRRCRGRRNGSTSREVHGHMSCPFTGRGFAGCVWSVVC